MGIKIMKRFIGKYGYSILTIGALLLFMAGWAQADIVTYKNGKVIKGIIEAQPGETDTVTLITDTGKIRIPRIRISAIQQESKSQGYLNIGAQYAAKGDLSGAIRAFQQAVDSDPANQNAKKLLDEAQAKLVEQQRTSRSDALNQIDKLGAQAKDLIKKGEFKQAENILKDADRLVPNAEQRAKLAGLISNMYLAWAEEREDKLDHTGSEQKLNLALAADPNNEKVVEKMLTLWEEDPAKRSQTVNIYETILERHPEDRILRKKLGDLYYKMNRIEDATHHYLELYKESKEYREGEVETRLIECLNKLHLQYARQKDFDKAIYYFQLLAALDQSVDPTEVISYQYAKREKDLNPKDLKGRLALAQFAEQNGLTQNALEQYRILFKIPQSKAVALAALTRFAQKNMTTARQQFQTGNYLMAAAMADQTRSEFPEIVKVQEEAADLIGRAAAEQAKDRRQKRELAKDVLKRGDEFYQQGQVHLNNLFSTERTNNPRLMSDRDMAKNYFTLAIKAYQEALQLDPSLGTDAESLVNVNLAQARTMLDRLNRRAPSMPENFGRPIVQPDTSGTE
jgi:tetratricopeptide (TPR) repeat protein